MCVLDYQKVHTPTMLTLFPIQWLALLAYFILRIVVGLVIFYLGVRHLQNRHTIAPRLSPPLFPFPLTATWLVALTEISSGLLLIFGIYTQIGALLLIALALKMLVWYARLGQWFVPSRITLVLFMAIGLSLFITGAGAFAFDLPI
jgi:uncharacterized membrane protein YphA (DoxX/SURF4 family)